MLAERVQQFRIAALCIKADSREAPHMHRRPGYDVNHRHPPSKPRSRGGGGSAACFALSVVSIDMTRTKEARSIAEQVPSSCI